MHWRKMKIHLNHWANSLEEEGREELISKILELIDGSVDEFYSSKNFYERKLEMLLSNMF